MSNSRRQADRAAPTRRRIRRASRRATRRAATRRWAAHFADGRSSAERSTGINPKGAEPIDPRMPNLSPA